MAFRACVLLCLLAAVVHGEVEDDYERLIGWKGEVRMAGLTPVTTCAETLGGWDMTSFGEEAVQVREFLDAFDDEDPLPEPYNYHAVHENVLSAEECQGVIDSTERYADLFGWTRHRHHNYPTTDVPITAVPSLSNFGNSVTFTRIIPLIEKTFGLKRHRLSIGDIFVVKYSAVTGQQQSLDAHKDGSQFSFVLSLNDAYLGGGTHFVHGNKTVFTPAGSVLVFCGKNKHEALPVTKGVRYLLTGFLMYGKADD